ncbi:hypothetical protein Ga0061061_11048 [Chelatococcus sambhunathii]|uniref:Uncharacterized protein n=1 Tax=Chelatococcus sambhunathii TaxID=363953 RepID=A0ABM9UCC6_9HYPH|nr:hypothetical protein Ga0061061_11048 [Chelatococcus sambhunathii]
MPALVAGIHDVETVRRLQDVDGRDKPGQDAIRVTLLFRLPRSC